MGYFPLTVTQTFSVTRTITVEREGAHWLDAVTRQAMDCAPDFDDPAWQTDWDLPEEGRSDRSPHNWDEVEGYDPDDLDDPDDE